MVYTLVQRAQMTKEPLAKGIMYGLAMEGLIVDLFHWRDIGAMSETGTRFDEVITPGWVPLNGTITESTANGHQITHQVYQMLQHIDIPVPLESVTGNVLQKPSQIQIGLLKKGAAYEMNDKFVNGDQGSEPNSFNGLNKIVGNLASSQTVAPAAQVDVTGTSNGVAAIDLIHKGMHRVEGHMPTAGFANEDFLLRFESILRQAQLLGNDYNWKLAHLEVDDPRRTQRTASSRPAFEYRGVSFFDLGVKADQSTKIIGNTYTDGGLGSTDNTRLFFIKEGPDDLEGIQAMPLTVEEIGKLQDKDNYRWRFRWIPGLAVWGPRSVVKVIGLKVA